jgi:hypothetical protein
MNIFPGLLRKKHMNTACVMYPDKFTWTIGIKLKTRIMKNMRTPHVTDLQQD